MSKMRLLLLCLSLIASIGINAKTSTGLEVVQTLSSNQGDDIPAELADYFKKFKEMDDKLPDVEGAISSIIAPSGSMMNRCERIDAPKFALFYNNSHCMFAKGNGDYVIIANYNNPKDVCFFVTKTYPDGSGFHNVTINNEYSWGKYVAPYINIYANPGIGYYYTPEVKAPDGETGAWMNNTDGTWTMVDTHNPSGTFNIDGVNEWGLVEKVWTASTLPDLKIVQNSYTKIEVYKGKELVKTFDPKLVSEYKLSNPDSEKIKAEEIAAKMKPIVGTYTFSDETVTGNQKKTYTITLKADGTCSATIKWYWKNVEVNRVTGVTITDVYNATFTFNKECKWTYDQSRDAFAIFLSISHSVPTGTVVTNGVKKRSLQPMEAIYAAEELSKAINNNVYVPTNNNTQLKGLDIPYVMKKKVATAAKSSTTNKK